VYLVVKSHNGFATAREMKCISWHCCCCDKTMDEGTYNANNGQFDLDEGPIRYWFWHVAAPSSQRGVFGVLSPPNKAPSPPKL